mgnify:CR=1 FL=1
MNNAILANLNVQSNITMSSREIAELIQKPHDNALKLIRNLIAGGIVKNTTPHNYIHPQNNQSYTEFLSDKRDSLVIVARLSPEFTAAVVDRWQQLENQTPSLPNFNDPVAAARAWADELEAKQVAIAKLEMARPKIAHYDNVVQKEGLLNATQVAQKVGLSAVALNRVLDELGVYNKAVKRSRVFSQWVIDKGLGVIKQTEQGFSQALFTLRGEAWVIEKLNMSTWSKGVFHD